MKETIMGVLKHWADYAIPAGIVLVSFLCGLALRSILFRKLTRWAEKTKSDYDDIVISSIRGPFLAWFLILGLHIALQTAELPPRAALIAEKALLVLVIASITFALANIASRYVRSYGARVDSTTPLTSLGQNVARILIFTIGFLVVIDALGIHITPILATLGVGGLAVALALQDSLANLFAGLHIIIAKQIRVGDYIKLESGEEGYITDINWRTTRIKMLPNNIVLVPNDKLAKSIVTNYHLPENEMSVLIAVGVHYRSDLKKVEEMTCDVAREVMREVPGGVPGFEPFIRYHTFNASSIDFSVILRAKEFVDQYLIKHEFIKRLHVRYAQEGIVIPFPIRAINREQENAEP